MDKKEVIDKTIASGIADCMAGKPFDLSHLNRFLDDETSEFVAWKLDDLAYEAAESCMKAAGDDPSKRRRVAEVIGDYAVHLTAKLRELEAELGGKKSPSPYKETHIYKEEDIPSFLPAELQEDIRESLKNGVTRVRVFVPKGE